MPNLVSIIMPMYNAELFVGDAVQSVLNQTYAHWELLIINDGSKDDSADRVLAFRDKRIRLLSQENKGVSAARNLGLDHMRGEYFCFLDADDILTPWSIQKRMDLFNEKVSFVDGGVDYFDSAMQHKTGEWRPAASGNVLKKLFRLDASCFFGLTWMVKRDPLLEYRFDEAITHGEDLLFFMTIAHSGDYACTPDVVLHYRKSQCSAMRNARGLAEGYTILRRRMRTMFPDRLSLYDKLVYDYKVRKIMFLTFFRSHQFNEAIRYLFLGRL